MGDHRRHVAFAVAPLFRARGWKKVRLNWYLYEAETILVFHVEKNRWGADDFSFHCGIYLNALGSERTPPVYRCPINTTVDRVAPLYPGIAEMGDFEDAGLTVSERIDTIREVTETIAIPWLHHHSNLAMLRDMAAQPYDQLFLKVFITRVAYDYLRSLPC